MTPKYKILMGTVGGFCNIIDGVFSILTLGFWYPKLTLSWMFWITKRWLEFKKMTRKKGS